MFAASQNLLGKSLGAARIACIYAGFSILWIIASDTFLRIAVSDPELQARIELSKGLIFVLITSILLYLILRAWSAPWKHLISADTDTIRYKGARWLVAAFIVLTLLVPLSGFLIVTFQTPQAENEAFASLQAIAELKSQQIENWMDERKNAGSAMLANDGFIRHVAQLRQQDTAKERNYIKNRIEAIRQAYGFEDILLLDGGGKLILGLVASHSNPIDINDSLIEDAFRTGTVQLSGLAVDKNGKTHWSYIVPLILQHKNETKRIGLALLYVNPERFLFPYIQRWPGSDTSGETLLIRRDGDYVSFLYQPRYQDSDAANVLLPLATPNLPEAVAIKTDKPGTTKGIDYHGTPVLAAFRPIKNTDWHLVAKLDRKEVLEPLKNLGFWISLVAFFATISISAAMLLLWRHQRLAQQLAIEHKADRLLRHFYDLPFSGMGIATPDMGRWRQCNQRLCEILGYSVHELASLGLCDLAHPEDVGICRHVMERLDNSEYDDQEINLRLVHKRGHVVFVSAHMRCVRNTRGEIDFVVVTMQDITERQANEARIEQLSHLYAASSHCNQAIVRCTRESELFDEICRIAVEFGGMKMAWIGLLGDDETIRPVSFYGEGLDYLDNLQVTSDANDPRSQGPVGKAVRSRKPSWNQDFLNDPATAPWHEGASRFKWQSVAALPLDQDGKVIGVFTLYSSEPQSFNQEARKLLMEMAGDISFALDNFSRDKARQRAESQLRLAARVFEQSNEGFMITDAENRIIMVNKAFTDITGFDEAEALGKLPAILSSGHQTPDFYRSMWESIEKEGHWQGEILNRRKNGNLYLEWLSISRIMNASGRTTQHVAIFSDITEHRATEERVNWLMHFDTLTGLPNRTLLEDRCKHSINLAQRSGSDLVLMFLDLDHFKNINDSLGHRIGDDLLAQFSQKLTAILREQDTVSRIGGDDFIIILPETDADGAAHLAEKLLVELARPFSVDQHELSITVSIGIAVYPNNGDDLDTLSRCAEAAMYRAKHDGRNTFRFFAKEMQEQASRNLKLENALRRALERNQLRLHYQPQVSLASGQIVGVEALLRWDHAEFGPVSPVEFIPIAESSGLILSIGEWVLRTAAHQMKTWLDQGLALSTMAVNLSAIQFRHPRLPDQILQALDQAGLAPQFLELELTESAAMEDPLAAVNVVKELRERGVRVSIDDFGTGHSSLGHLKRFNACKLKIDRSFVRDIASDPDDRAIVDAIISMASSLGMQTIAEGVETEEQLAFLRSHGCQEVQGFYFSQPLPADQFEQLMQDKLPSD